MRVLLTGSTGFVGKGILPTLLTKGHEVTCLVRPGSIDKKELLPDDRVHIAHGDIFDLPSLEHAAEGCDAVVHLVGIIREDPKRGITFPRIHVQGTENLLQAAKKAGITRFVHMSALGSRPGATSAYHQTKYAAEQAVINSGLTNTIFRPSVIFGPGDEFVNMLADLVRLPITPVIGDGTYKLQPVSRQTVAEIFSQALTSPDAEGKIFEAGGPEQLSYLEILDSIGSVLRKPRVRKLHIPINLMKPIVSLLEGFPLFPITSTQLVMLQEGNYCNDTETLYQVFDTKKIPFREGISTYVR